MISNSLTSNFFVCVKDDKHQSDTRKLEIRLQCSDVLKFILIHDENIYTCNLALFKCSLENNTTRTKLFINCSFLWLILKEIIDFKILKTTRFENSEWCFCYYEVYNLFAFDVKMKDICTIIYSSINSQLFNKIGLN